jgi:hypothetical protein
VLREALQLTIVGKLIDGVLAGLVLGVKCADLPLPLNNPFRSDHASVAELMNIKGAVQITP